MPHSRSTPGSLGDREQGRRDVAVADESDPRSRLADQLHGVLVAGPVEHDHGDVAHLDPPALGDPPDHVGERVGQAQAVGDLGAAGDLLHVDAGARVEHRSPLRQRDHRERRRLALGGEPGALERVHGDVHLGRAAVADPLAVVEHRRLVLLALADHDHAVHRHRVEHQPHRVDRRLVGRLLLAPADPARGGERRGLRHPDELEREVAVGPRARANVVRDDARLARPPRPPLRLRPCRGPCALSLLAASERRKPVAAIAIAASSASQ